MGPLVISIVSVDVILTIDSPDLFTTADVYKSASYLLPSIVPGVDLTSVIYRPHPTATVGDPLHALVVEVAPSCCDS